MIRRFLVLCATPLIPFLLCQCGDSDPGPVLVGKSQKNNAAAAALFSKAQAEENKGDYDDAIDLYGDVADDYALSPNAGESRYRQAMLLDQKEGDTRGAFKAYDQLLSHYPNHPKNRTALKRIYDIANAAVRGDVQTSFLGLKSNLDLKQVLPMLEAVKRHAPQSDFAAKSQYAIGELYLREKKPHDAVRAFRRVADEHHSHSLAAESLFRVGKILLNAADKGNQNQATIDLAREALNDYLIQFPGHKHSGEARKLMASLKSREVKRSIDVADYYYKTGQMESAKIYYREVIKSTKSGAAHERAKARLKELGN